MATTPQLAPWLIESLNEDTIFVKLAEGTGGETDDIFDGILSPLPTNVDLMVPSAPRKKRNTFTPIHSPVEFDADYSSLSDSEIDAADPTM